ncbi:MAG: MFS transporter [Candidatus Korobacteraceae bacterium]|jgi:ACS family glucarate transporter-like MFS transporter
MDSENTKAYRVGVVALLTAGTFINSLDRASLSVAAPFIIKEFHINTAVMGVALSAFFWTYAVGNLPAGYLADRYGSKTVFGWAAAAWSIFSAITGFCNNVFHLVLARLGVGLGESAALPATAKIIAANFPSKERGTATSVALTGIRAGLAVTPFIMAFLIKQWGWRVAFYATGLGSLLWCVVWYFWFQDRSDIRAKQSGQKQKVKIPWGEVLHNRTLLGIIVVKFTQDFLQWLFLTWVPSYLIMERGFSIMKMGIYGSLPYATAGIIQPFVGIISDWLIRRGWSVNRARKTVQVVMQLLSATIIIVGFVDNVMVAIFFLTVSIAAESNCAGHIWVIISEVVPPKYVGSVGGLINMIGSFAGIISPILTGIVVKMTGSFRIALTVGGCSILVATFFLLVVVPKLGLLSLGEAQPDVQAAKA